MADSPSSENKDKSSEPPAPEALKPQDDRQSSPTEAAGANPAAPKVAPRPRHATYRPSHKATFVGIGVVVAILAINVAVIIFVMRTQDPAAAQNRQGEVTLSSEALDQLGVTRTAVNNLGTELVVGPNSRFNGKVTIGSDVSIGGQLRLNSRFTAGDASLTRLEAGETSVGQLNINGDATVSNLNVRRDLAVVGQTRFQGPVTASQLFTINNNLNVSGNLAVGGTLSARSFQASSLVSDTTLIVGGHIISRGAAPSVTRGSGNALGSNGTISISGSDAVGTVAANVGVGASSGVVANVTFRQPYSGTPRVIVTGGGSGVGNWYVTRSTTGFTIGVSTAMPPGGYHFDYIVMQ